MDHSKNIDLPEFERFMGLLIDANLASPALGGGAASTDDATGVVMTA